MGRNFVMWHLSFALLLAACSPAPATPVVVPVEATDLALPLAADLAAAYREVNPDVLVIPSAASLSSVSGDLAAGAADLALTAQPDPGQFATPLAYVSFNVVVNPANPIASLSAAQVQEVFAGRANDWGQVGGAGGAIQIVSREKGSDAETAFGASALAGASPALTALAAPSWEAMRAYVSQKPNAVGYLPAPEMDTSVKAVSVDAPLRVLIVALAAKEPTGPARDFLLWAQSAEGQAVVARRYEVVR